MRPQILFPLFGPLRSLKGVGDRIAPLLERVAGPRLRDLIFLPPHGLTRRTPRTLDDLRDGELCVARFEVVEHVPPARAGQPWRLRGEDGNGAIQIVWFKGHGAHLERAHPPGTERIVAGRADRGGPGPAQIVHPDYLLPVERADEVPLIETLYPATAGLPVRTVRRCVLQALEKAPAAPEWQDPTWLTRQRWPSWREALMTLHNPQDEADLSLQSPWRRRLAFDELLAHQLALARRRQDRRAAPAPEIPASALAEQARAALPFELTGAQDRALAEIRGDLVTGERMSRLLQGDVGSGKTVVAMLAMVDVAAAGLQSALMAPTEILARQHFETLREPLLAVGLEAVLLTGRHKGAGRRELLAGLETGRSMVAVGTHALFQDDVAFRSLGLVVIDEQHRFGVSERARLTGKGASPHLLAMSATPIPRTLELTVFGDLDVSRLDEKPPGRQPVATRAAPLTRLQEVVDRLRAAAAAGAQAFWICPLVSESEVLDVTAAEARHAALVEVLGPRVGLIHGRLPPAQKDEVMGRFVAGEVSVLVATTVVEVGVNVPNATIMVIEQAERFGLAQLHQLRGRVGRGSKASSCVLLYDPPLGDIARRRLDTLRRTEDGFEIAEQDLELRGGGDPLGLAQSGFPAYRLADPVAHRDLIQAAADDARLAMQRGDAPGADTPRGQALAFLEALFDWQPDSDLTRGG